MKKQGIVWVDIEHNGITYNCVKLAGPEAIIYKPSGQDWDYDKEPVGPGTLGWGKPKEEIEDLKDRYLLVDKIYLTDSMGVAIKYDGLIVKKHGVYNVQLSETEWIEGELTDMNVEEIKNKIHAAFVKLAKENNY